MNPLESFLADHAGPVGLVSDYDADGLSAAVLMESYLDAAGREHRLRTPVRERNVWDTPTSNWLEPESELAVVMDLGSRGDKLFPVPTLFIDHHHYNPPAEVDLLYTGYDRDPVPTTAGLVWELVREKVPEGLWLAALGTYGDLGSKADFDYLREAKKLYTAKALGETVSLVNAARRAPEPRIDLPLALLRQFDDPRELLASDRPELLELRRLREAVREETEKGKKAAPVFSGDVALVVISSTYQVHPLIAQIWRSRLTKYYVLVANPDYQPGLVHFAGRSSSDKSILKKLRSLTCWAEDAGFGQGHDQASGGAVPEPLWADILRELGFRGSETSPGATGL